MKFLIKSSNPNIILNLPTFISFESAVMFIKQNNLTNCFIDEV